MGAYLFKALTAKPSAAIRSDYNAFSKLCHETGEPVLVTKNGEGDLVVMSQEAYNEMTERIALTMELIAADREFFSGAETIPARQVFASLREAIHENARD